ncbi:hypothetical protein GGQ21_001232 [Salinibacter ruber]|jgi:hypothetical protein|uniref:hypothetical protein n=1 Tax=Salinibacter sp. TaxID=2065818 RepID=UPI0021E8FFD6|nr:hypothetical protein [Salinibacter sp.]MCS3670584.1 hypothetical protein [Salinibacter ruber]
MLKEWERDYFRKNKGSQAQIWQGNLSVEVGDEGVAVVDHAWDEDSDTEPEPDKQTLTEPDERRTVYNKWNSTWILIDIYE